MDLNEIMKQAQQMQEQMKKNQEELANKEVSGESGAGLVKVVMNGRYEMKGIELDPAILDEGKEVTEDLIVAAVNDAVRKVSENTSSQMSGLTSGLNLPEGFKFPF